MKVIQPLIRKNLLLKEKSTCNRGSTSEVEEFHSSIGDFVVVYCKLNKNILRYLRLVQGSIIRVCGIHTYPLN